MNPDPSVPVLAQEAGTAISGAEQVAEPRPQIVGGLNDTVFGLAITLLATALNIRPNSAPILIIQQLVGFGYSFTIIATVWLRRYRLVRSMRTETVGFLRLNFVLLFLIISYTYVLRLFALAPLANGHFGLRLANGDFLAVVILFTLLTTFVMATLAAQHQYALAHDLVMPAQRLAMARARDAVLMVAAFFAVSIPFLFVSYPLATVLWVCTIPAGVIIRRRNRLYDRHAAHSAEHAKN